MDTYIYIFAIVPNRMLILLPTMFKLFSGVNTPLKFLYFFFCYFLGHNWKCSGLTPGCAVRDHAWQM